MKGWKKIRLNGKKVFLRPVRKKDAPDTRALINDRRVTLFLSLEPPITLKQEQKFLAEAERNWKTGKAFVFAVCDQKTGLVTGICRLHSYVKKSKRAKIGIFLGKPFWGKGFGFEAAFLLFKFGFKKLKLNRIQYSYLVGNHRSENMAKKMGCKKEGVKREHTFKRGHFFDQVITSLLASEWKKKWGKQ